MEPEPARETWRRNGPALAEDLDGSAEPWASCVRCVFIALSPGGVIAAQASAMGRGWSLLRAPPRSWGRESYSSQHISAMHLSAHDVDGGGEELGVDACGGAVAGQSS